MVGKVCMVEFGYICSTLLAQVTTSLHHAMSTAAGVAGAECGGRGLNAAMAAGEAYNEVGRVMGDSALKREDQHCTTKPRLGNKIWRAG